MLWIHKIHFCQTIKWIMMDDGPLTIRKFKDSEMFLPKSVCTDCTAGNGTILFTNTISSYSVFIQFISFKPLPKQSCISITLKKGGGGFWKHCWQPPFSAFPHIFYLSKYTAFSPFPTMFSILQKTFQRFIQICCQLKMHQICTNLKIW